MTTAAIAIISAIGGGLLATILRISYERGAPGVWVGRISAVVLARANAAATSAMAADRPSSSETRRLVLTGRANGSGGF
jgi:hypothetical protein